MFLLALLVTGISAVATAADDLFPGRTSNMVGPPPAQPEVFGDTEYRQQNEPCCAVTLNIPAGLAAGSTTTTALMFQA